MRDFNYSKIAQMKWDSEILSYIAAIYKEAGKQELYLKQRPEELDKLVEIAKSKVRNPPTPSKESSLQVRGSGSWWRKKRHLKIGMNRKSPAIGMCSA